MRPTLALPADVPPPPALSPGQWLSSAERGSARPTCVEATVVIPCFSPPGSFPAAKQQEGPGASTRRWQDSASPGLPPWGGSATPSASGHKTAPGAEKRPASWEGGALGLWGAGRVGCPLPSWSQTIYVAHQSGVSHLTPGSGIYLRFFRLSTREINPFCVRILGKLDEKARLTGCPSTALSLRPDPMSWSSATFRAECTRAVL